jgi:hypothetical protein
LVELLIGLLFVSISATVTPASLGPVVLPTVGVVAILMLVTRPLVAFLATLGSKLTRAQRAFIGWMDPRGIVAAATASTFAPALVAAHVGGASKILPATFLVIVLTVSIYGLSAISVAKKLGVRNVIGRRTLVVGGQPWVIDVARALRQSGVGVVMWAPGEAEREQIKKAGIDLVPFGALGAVLSGTAELPPELRSVTGVLLLTEEDGFNILASGVLAALPRLPVYRLAPRRDGYGLVAQAAAGVTLFPNLSEDDITKRYRSGSHVTATAANGALPAGTELLFVVGSEGGLTPVTSSGSPAPEPGDTAIVLEPATAS